MAKVCRKKRCFQGFTKNMLSTFYDIDARTIERYVADNIDELTGNGYEVLKDSRLKKFIEIVASLDVPDMNVGNISNRTPQLAIFDFKSLLNIGMLLVERDVLYLFDEPEVSLSPQNQEKLAEKKSVERYS